MNKNNVKKIHKVQISYAQTFGYRTKCKFCLSVPKYSYFVMSKAVSNHLLYENKRYSEKFMQSYLADESYLNGAVKSRDFHISFLFDPTASYTGKMAITTGKYQQNKDPFTAVVECKCGKTTWAFVASNRDHIYNRKCELSQSINVKSLYKILV